jgi:two-component system nitrate/nitrite response regulator NarL
VTFLRVLLVDSHAMLTDALTVRLSSADDLWVVGSVSPEDPRLIDIVRTQRPDVITTEVGQAAVATGGLLRKLRAAWPPAQLVVLTASHDNTHAVAAARAGAAAWVSKESSLEHLLEVLRGVPLGYASTHHCDQLAGEDPISTFRPRYTRRWFSCLYWSNRR